MRASVLASTSALILSAGLAGCGTTSMVQSVAVAQDKLPPERGKATAADRDYGPSYLTYYLPQTLLSVKLTAKKAGGGDDSKDDKATASSSATVTNTVTITSGKAEEKTDKDDKGDDKAKVASVCDQLRARYEFLQSTHTAFTLQWQKDLLALDTLAAGPLDTEAARTKANKAVADFNLQNAVDDRRVAAAWPVAQRFLKLKCAIPVTVAITVLTQADTKQAYRLHVKDDSTSADAFTAKLDAQGLISSISTTADDKSADVAVGAVKSIGQVVGASLEAKAPPPQAQYLSQPLSLPSVAAPKRGGANFAEIKPPTPAQVEATFRRKLQAQIDKLRKQEPVDLPTLAPPLPDNPIILTLEDVDKADATKSPPVFKQLGDSAYYLTADCSAGSEGMAGRGDALLVSSPRTCRIWVVAGEYGFGGDGLVAKGLPSPLPDQSTWQAWTVSALDSRYPIQAPLMRTRLVKRAQGYEFKDGAVTQVTYDKPSDGAAAVAVPGNLIGGLFSGISAGIQGRQGNYKDQAALLDAKASVLNSQAALIKAQADLEAARKPKATTDAGTEAGSK